MRVLVVGAAGQIGGRLVPQLVARGHTVFGTTRSPDRTAALRTQGAVPLVLDLLDAEATLAVVLETRPDVIVHEATALAGLRDLRRFDRSFALTNRLRTEGIDNLLAAARAASVSRVVAQSFAGHRHAREGPPAKSENDTPDTHPVASMRRTLAALNHLDRTVSEAGGVALRYGYFYGARDDELVRSVRRGRVPLIGEGGGVWSFVHLDDAASATVLAVEAGPNVRGVYNVVDDEPAPVREWLPQLAAAVGARSPRRLPRWLALPLAGAAPVVMSTEARGARNDRAKRELGWTLRHPSWRQGFAEVYGTPAAG